MTFERAVHSACCIVGLTCGLSWADLTTVITAIPTTRCVTSADTAYCETIDPRRAEDLRMTLMKDPGPYGGSIGATYYWIVGGESREVVRGGRVGMFATFVDLQGGGMVAIHKLRKYKEITGKSWAPDEEPLPNFRYMEITRSGLGTLTYFGDAHSFEP